MCYQNDDKTDVVKILFILYSDTTVGSNIFRMVFPVELLASCPVEEGACLAEEDHRDPSFLVASASFLVVDHPASFLEPSYPVAYQDERPSVELELEVSFEVEQILLVHQLLYHLEPSSVEQVLQLLGLGLASLQERPLVH